MVKEKIKSSSDGLMIELAYLVPDGKIKGIVQISHGMSEHKERYYDFMEYLKNNGYISIIHDHRGHGASIKNKNDLGYFYTEDINYIVNDLEDVTKFIKQKYKGLKLYLFSHSMGTLVSRNYIKKYDFEIEKLILCGPPTKNNLTHFAVILSKISKFIRGDKRRNYFLDKLTFSSYGKEWVSSSKETQEKYKKDELSGFTFTTNGFINLYKLMESAFIKKEYKVKNPNLKIFVIAGSNDPVISNEKKFRELIIFLKEVGYKFVSSKIYTGLKHELLNEDEKDIVYKDILDFIEGDTI